jgi:hypothetical protein
MLQGYFPLLRHLVMKDMLHQCFHVLFPFHSQFVEEMFLVMSCQLYGYACLPKFASVKTIFVSFDLGLSRGGVDTLVLGINYFIKTWEHMHAIVGCLK